ncbi:hypothetical protein CLOP_g2016 [Closterium sp. NIES-67]|nr:hypothetical protein CLOP_g2016 [Closterium sp. NIES-67]
MKPPSGERAQGGAVQGSGAQGEGAQGNAYPGMYLMVEDVHGHEAASRTCGSCPSSHGMGRLQQQQRQQRPKATAGGDATAPTDGVLEAVKKVQQQQTHGEVLAGVDASAAWAKASSKSGEADWETWHERLCHVNFPMLQKLVKDGSLKGLGAVNMLRAFGCMVVFHVPKEKRGKLEASGRWGVHLGIAKDHKGWLLWDLTTQKLTVSRDVKFLESLYYKEWKQQQQKLPSIPLIRPRRDVRPPVRLTYGGRGKPNVVQAGSVVEQIEEDEIAHCYWAPIPEPKTREEALNGPDGEKWKASEDEEFGSLIENETWDLCDLPPGKKAITSKMIYRHKYGPEGELTRYKSRLVARGFQQTKGKDYDEVFAPVGKGTH